nr:hypothetical protein [Tanacetum cinerariifolium]
DLPLTLCFFHYGLKKLLNFKRPNWAEMLKILVSKKLHSRHFLNEAPIGSRTCKSKGDTGQNQDGHKLEGRNGWKGCEKNDGLVAQGGGGGQRSVMMVDLVEEDAFAFVYTANRGRVER